MDCVGFTHFNFPEGLAASSGGGRSATSGAEEHMLRLFVLVHGEEFFLFGVEQAHDVAAFENLVQIFTVLHEQSHLPRGARVNNIHLRQKYDFKIYKNRLSQKYNNTLHWHYNVIFMP